MALAENMEGGISAKAARRKPGLSALWRAWLWTLAGMAGAGRSALKTRHVRLWISDDGISALTANRNGTKALNLEFAAAAESTDWVEIKKALRKRRAGRRPVVLRIAADRVLVKTLRLPAAAGDVIEPVLRNQMQRLTPWPEDEVLFGYGVLSPKAGSNHIDVEVVAAHRPIIDDLMSSATKAGLLVARVDHASSPEARDGIALYDVGRRNQLQTARRFGRLLTIITAIGLCIGAIGLVEFARTYRANENLGEQIGFAQTRIADHARTRNQRHAVSGIYQTLLARRTKQAPAIWVMNEVTKAVPDHSWLTEFTLSGSRILITGSSANAAKLITALEQTAAFNDVRFTAATTRDRNSNRERFAIGAEVVFSGRVGAQP